jgi:hypothetical protein
MWNNMTNVNPASEIAALFRRDLTRLLQELHAFPPDDPALWKTLPGVTNSAGHLFIHLEGVLREYVGRHLGKQTYTRQRDHEFTCAEVPSSDLAIRLEDLRTQIPDVLAGLQPSAFEAIYPETIRGVVVSTQLFLMHMHGHLHYHLGQIDYLRRILLQTKPIDFAGL